ncbi:protein kinase [bacterium]|jgi:DNA-binding NarL/FixJ family response regulator/tRNA A-37 threonylcarbamoyl transferase component Bud32|nr:protein kinase [bacterium]
MSQQKPITILIAEDQAITRFGLKCSLEAYTDLTVVSECGDGASAILQALAVKPDVILMDIGLPTVDGIRASKEIKEVLPSTHIIMFTASDDNKNIFEALEAGADGYCLKTVAGEHLYAAIKAVTAGATWLDPGIARRLLKVQNNRNPIELQDTSPFLKSSKDSALSDEQMAILKMLSAGCSLEAIANRTSSSLDNVGSLVQETLDLLLHAAKQELNDRGEAPITPYKAGGPDKTGIKNYQNGRTPIGDRYEIDGVLGRGGMGIVYRGKHVLMNRPVAIKMLHPEHADDDSVVARFQSEAQTLSQLSHPNLVSVFDFGITANNEPYMIMDFHAGNSLDSYLVANGILNTEIGICIFEQVLSGLSVVHKAGIVHRDIKPGNIIVSRDRMPMVKIVDFGIAKNPSTEKERLKITNTGEVIGTPRYMSPEQCTGKELDARSDIYALGCVMYECFTGKPTFDGDSFYDMVRLHLNETPSRLPFFQPGVNHPKELVDIIFTALQKKPDDRYQSAEEMLVALNKVPVNLANSKIAD